MVGGPTRGMVSAYHIDIPGSTLVRVAEFGLPPSVEPVCRTLAPHDTNAWRVFSHGEEFLDNLSRPGLGDPDLLDPVIASRNVYAILLPLAIGERRWGILAASWTSPPDNALLDSLRRFVQILSLLDDVHVTRRKLRRAHVIVEAASEATAVGLLVLRSDGTLITYNGAMETLVGWTVEDVRSRGWVNLAYPDQAYRAQASADGRALLSGAMSGVDRQVRCKDGSTRTLRVMSRALSVEDESEPWIFGLFQDSSADKLALAASAEATLYRAFGAFAAAQSNELTNTLTPIQGHLELLSAEPDISAVVRARAHNIATAVQRGVAMSKRLRLLALPHLVEPGAVDLADELRDLVVDLHERTGLEVSVTNDPDLPPVSADAPALRQALEELMQRDRPSGAARGPVSVALRRASPPAGCTFASSYLDSSAEHVLVSIRDDSVPLLVTAISRLALPLHLQTDQEQGLGFSVARSVIDAHSGAIHVSDDGNQVDVYLPISEQPVHRSPPLQSLLARGDELVWAVDDEDDLVEFVALSLEARGYRVLSFTTAHDVLKVAEDDQVRRPDVLVLDVMLATKRGPDLLRELRRRGVRAPVVWTSGYNADTARVPLDDDKLFLGKPFKGVELAAAVRRLLDKRLV